MTSTFTRCVRAMLAPALLAVTAMTALPANAQGAPKLYAGENLLKTPHKGAQALYVRLIPGQTALECEPKTVSDTEFDFPVLNVETGKLLAGKVGRGFLSAQWIMRYVGSQPAKNAANPDLNLYTFENLWTHKVLAAWPASSSTQAVDAVDASGRVPELRPQQVSGGATMRTVDGDDITWVVSEGGDGVWMINQSSVRVDRKDLAWKLSMQAAGCAASVGAGPGIWYIDIVGAEAPPPPAEGYVWLQPNTGGLEAVNIETGAPSLTKVQDGWLSAQWERKSLSARAQQLQPLEGSPVLYINRWTGKALAIDSAKKLTTVDPPTFDNTGKLSSRQALWQEVPGDGGFKLKNEGNFLNVQQSGALEVANANPTLWTTSTTAPNYVAPAKVEQYVRLRHDKHAINNETGAPTSTDYQDGWYSAQWIVETMGAAQGRVVAYRNRWTNKYLGVVNGKLEMVDGITDLRDPSQATYLWRVVGGTPDASKKSLQNTKSSLYLGDNGSGAALSGTARFDWREEDVK